MTERDLLSVIHPESDDDLTVRVGEKLVLKGVTRTVTDLDVATLPRSATVSSRSRAPGSPRPTVL